MSRILTVTANPAIDVSSVTDVVTVEHKLRCTEVRRDPGGGGINVARVLTRFGAPCAALYPTGGILGRLLQRLLDEEGIASITLEIREETRESFTVLERKSGREFRFVLPGPQLTEREYRALIDRVVTLPDTPSFIVASGSLPSGVPTDFYAALARIARTHGSRLAVDTSGPPLAAALAEGVYLIKPNLRELRELTGKALEHEDDWARAAQHLVQTGKAEIVALSLGHRGAILATRSMTLRAPALQVTIASTVGAGDSFLAGLIHHLAADRPLEDALRYAVASGTAALLHAGTSLATRGDTEQLAHAVEVRRVD